MNDQATEGAVAPVVDAPTPAPETTEVEAPKPEPTEGEKPAKPAKSGEQIRIDELTRRLRETERRYERVLRMAEERAAPEPTPPPQTPAKPKTLEDFGYDQAAFLRHVNAETAATAAEAAKAALARERAQEQAAARREAFDARADAFAKTVEDYEEVINGKWSCSQPMAEVIEESEEGPAIAYYLAQNPDEAARLSKLSAAQAGRELAKLEVRLDAERKKAAEKAVTKAPPPPPKVDGAGDGSPKAKPDDPASDSELSDAEWTRRRNAQIAARNRRS